MKRSLPFFLLLLLPCCDGDGAGRASSPAGTAAPASLRFVDVTAEAGCDQPIWYGRPDKPHILESGGTGLALLDYDGDDDLDLYFVNGWRLEGAEVLERGRNRLLRNDGAGRFEDVTGQAGVGDDGWGCGVEVGDIDGDGHPDLFVTNFGPDVLYRNRGDGTFEPVADAPGIDGWSAGAVLFDADGDGDNDLFVTAYIDCTLDQVLSAEPELEWEGQQVMLGPFGLEGAANLYFENTGGGRFREATEQAGLTDKGRYYSFAVVALDLDADLDLDLYVANDSNPNYVYQNDGAGHFQEVGLWSGAALDANGMAQAGMGLAAGDIDNDALPDLFVTNFEADASTLYENQGDCFFTDVTRALGVRESTYAPLSWGTILADFDLDADLDLFVANGHIYPQADRVEGRSYAQPNLLLAWDGESFRDVTGEAGPGLAVRASSRGVAVGDIDGDGDLDLAIANIDAPPTLLRNDSSPGGSWLLVDAPGAVRVEVTVQGRRLVRHAVRGGSYISVSDPRLHFGLGSLGPAARVDAVAVLWPDGESTVLEDVAADQVLRVERGE